MDNIPQLAETDTEPAALLSRFMLTSSAPVTAVLPALSTEQLLAEAALTSLPQLGLDGRLFMTRCLHLQDGGGSQMGFTPSPSPSGLTLRRPYGRQATPCTEGGCSWAPLDWQQL